MRGDARRQLGKRGARVRKGNKEGDGWEWGLICSQYSKASSSKPPSTGMNKWDIRVLNASGHGNETGDTGFTSTDGGKST